MAKRRSEASLDLSRLIQRSFGEKVRQIRKVGAFRRTQGQLAAALGITRTTMSNIENGNQRVFLDQAFAIARALGVPATLLFPDERAIFESSIVHIPSDAGINATQFGQLADVLRRAQENPVDRDSASQQEELESYGH